MGIAVPLLKASVIAALVFAAAWIRIPVSVSNLDSVVGDFVGFGLVIVILSLTVGYVLAFIAVKLQIVRWWSSVAVAAAVGALLGGLCTYKPSPPPNTVEVENPHAFAFSPWNRDNPGDIRGVPLSYADFVGSVAFLGTVGAVLGLAFWYFYSRARASRVSPEASVERN
jgi:hypothetical protein